MANTTVGLTNVNLLSKEQYEAIANPSNNELWAVELESDAEFKEKVTSWGDPDNSSVSTITTTKGSSFTCPNAGYLVLSLYCYTKTGYLAYSSSLASYISNVYCIKTHASDDGRQAVMFRVQKGEVLTCTLSVGDNIQAFFVPMKGVK